MTISVNLVTDYATWGGAAGLNTGNSASTNAGIMREFRDWATDQTDDLLITLPAGDYPMGSGLMFDGITEFVFDGAGASFQIDIAAESGFDVAAHGGFKQISGYSARTERIRPGDTVFTCLTPDEASIFPVDRWVALTACDWQSEAGFPPNHQYLQYVQVVDADPILGKVTFTPAAKMHFKTIYPETSDYLTNGGYDTGGPATAFLMANANPESGTDPTSFETTVVFNDLEMVNINGTGNANQIYMGGKSLTLSDMSFTDIAPIVSQNQTATFNNLIVPDIQVEADKQTENFVVNGGTYRRIQFQSTSIQNCELNGVTSTVTGISGTPKNLYMHDCPDIINLTVGPSGYGCTETLILENNNISQLGWESSNRLSASDFEIVDGNLVYQGYTGTGGMTFMPDGCGLFLAGQISSNHGHIGYHTRVIDRSVNIDGLVVLHCDPPVTTLAPSFLVGEVFVVQHPCLDVSGSGNTGTGIMEDINNAPDHLPLYSYIKRVDVEYTTNEFGNEMIIWGKLGTTGYIKINVTQAANATLNLGGQYNNMPVIHLDDTADYDWGGSVNLSHTGERIITANADGVISVANPQTGDDFSTIEALGDVSFINGVNLYLTGDAGSLVTFEMLTDQGYPGIPKTFSCSFS